MTTQNGRLSTRELQKWSLKSFLFITQNNRTSYGIISVLKVYLSVKNRSTWFFVKLIPEQIDEFLDFTGSVLEDWVLPFLKHVSKNNFSGAVMGSSEFSHIETIVRFFFKQCLDDENIPLMIQNLSLLIKLDVYMQSCYLNVENVNFFRNNYGSFLHKIINEESVDKPA